MSPSRVVTRWPHRAEGAPVAALQHPSVRDQVAANIGAVRQAHPAVGVIELMDDEGLDPLSCVVVSEAGEVRAGIAQQIEAIRTALAGANAAIGAG